MKLILFGTLLFSALVLIIPGIMLRYKKAYWLISGYNTMSQEKKKNVDIIGLSRFISSLCFVLAIIIILLGIFLAIGKGTMAGVAAALIFPVSIYMLIKAQMYDGNTRNPDGTTKIVTKIIIGAVCAFLTLTFIGIGILMYFSSKPSEYLIIDDKLEILGLYKQSINIKDIKEIVLIESLPEVKYKTNGSSIGNVMKGSFIMKGIGAVKLYADTSKPPFIYIDEGAKPLIINSDTAEKTRELFEKIKQTVIE